MSEKVVMTFDLLEGTDGRKMSKSYGNIIGVMDSPAEMYGKVMSLSDNLIARYFHLCTDKDVAMTRAMEKRLATGELHPRDAKMKLAKEIVTLYHSEKDATEAELEFTKIFQQKEQPTEIAEYATTARKLSLVEIVVEVGFAASKSDARRKIEQGGVRLNDNRETDAGAIITIEDGMVLQVGKRNFVTLRFK